jgi:hypothetical protein
MKLPKIIIGEILLLGASILIFRSVWTLLDQYLGPSNLWLLMIIGIAISIIALVIINREVECTIGKAKKQGTPK